MIFSENRYPPRIASPDTSGAGFFGIMLLVPHRVPPADDAVLVPQRDVAVRVFPCGRIEGRVADAAAGGDRQHLLDALFGLIPKLHFVGQILPSGGHAVEPDRLAPRVIRIVARSQTPSCAAAARGEVFWEGEC